MFCTTAFAATGAQDGVSAELTTDKATYAAGEVMNVTLVVKNGNARVNNVRTELVIPAGVSLTTGALVSEGVDLAPNAEATYNYGLTVNEVETPTTTPSGGDNAPETGDISLMIYGVLAIASLTGLVVLMGGKNIFKQRWFALVLCGALLLGVIGPVAASAAATEKTFEVTETVTIAGTAAEVKAVITYDLNDDVVHTEDVAFKKDGQYLWNVDVEQGYYLPSDVEYDGKTTSKDGAFRPEVNAPYIDMLFGTTKKAGEFKTNIFNANAQQTVLMGLTDDAASKAALEMIDEDEWIIALIDGKLVVTGWYDNATAAAARALYALGSADAADITLSLPMIGKMNYVNVDLPAVTFGNFRGGMDSDFGAVILRWNEVVADDFDAYCAALEAAGYTMIESNTMAGFKNTKTLEFATYVKGDDAVLVQYLPVSLLDQDPATLNAVELKAYQAAYSADGDSIRLILTSADLLGNTAEENTGWTDLGITPKMHNVNLYNKQADDNDIGQCEIFTLADGSYIIVDGGQSADAEQVYRTLSYMNERPDGKIVIAAWFLTHAHADHTGALGSLAASEWASEITIEQMILNPVAKSYRWRTEYDPYGWYAGFSAEFDNIKTVTAKFAQGENYQLILPHMGQVMHIRNAEVEMLTVGDEDMYPVIFNNDNGQSLAFRVTFPGVTIDGADQSVMILGDSALDQTYNVYFPLMCGELYADIIQVSHHGLGGQTSRFYPMFSGIDVSIFPTTWRTIDKHGLIYSSSTNKGLQIENGGTTQLNIVCDEYVQTLHLPFDVKNDHVLRTKIGTYKTKFQDTEMDIALLPAFRFGAQWTAKKDIIISYLKEYTSDVLILPLVDKNAQRYNKTDVANELAEALDYAYAYYAPVWGCDAEANMETGDGTVGHLILSTYPILKAETGILVEGTPDAKPEGRGYAHVLLDVEGVEMDVVATHFNDKGNWTKFAELYEQWGQYTIIAGNTKIKGDVTQTGGALASAAFDTDVTVLGTEGITFVDSKTDNRLATEGDAYFVNKNMSAIYTTKAVFSLYTAPEASTAPVRQAVVSWWAHSWGGSYGNFAIIAQNLKDYNPGLVAFQQISNSTIGLTPEQILAETGYEYGHYVEVLTTSAGKTIGHMALSHYPIEILEDLIISDGSDDQYKEQRAFGHIVVTINGTEIDLWYGGMDGSANQLAKLEAAVNAVATESGRPFIISTNDCNGMVDLTSFAGYGVYSYSTPYMANVLVSTGKVTVTKAEAIKTSISYPTMAGMDDMNLLDLDVEQAPAILNWWAGNWGGSNDKFETIMADVRTQNIPIVTFQQINNKLIGATAEQVAKEAGYENFHYVDCYAKADGTFNGHMILSHYPIEVLDTIVLREIGSTEGESRTFGHVIVDINGTKTDVYFGATDWLSADHMKALEAHVAKFASETGRPFIVSANDMPSQDVTSFGGVEVYNYRTGYVSAVMVSKGALEVTKTETIPSAASGGAIDKMNIIRFEVVGGGLTPGDPFVPPVTPEPEPEPDPEPEVPEGTPVTLKTLEWWCNFGGGTTPGQVDEIVAFMQSGNFDVAVLTHWSPKYFTDESVFESFTKELGFDHYAYVTEYNAAGDTATGFHVLLSKYPIIESKQVSGFNGSDAVRAFGKAVLDINGLAVDAFWGFFGGTATDEQRAQVEADIAAARTSDSFIFLGGQFKAYTEYAGAKVAQQATGNSIVASEGITMANGKTIAKADIGPVTAARASIDPPIYAELTVYIPEKEEPEDVSLRTLEWWCNWHDNATVKETALNYVKEGNYDLVALIHIPVKDVNKDTAGAFAESMGFKYYAWVEADADLNNGIGVGHLLLSQYELTDAAYLWAYDIPDDDDAEGRSFGYACLNVGGTKIDVFYGETKNADVNHAQHVDLMSKIDSKNGDNDFILFGYNFTARAEYAGKEVVMSSANNVIMTTTGIRMDNAKRLGTIKYPVDGESPIPIDYARIDPAVYAELTVKLPEPEPVVLKTLEWWCNWHDNASVKETALNYIKEGNYDLVGLIHIPVKDVNADNAADFAASMGFMYYAWVEADADLNDGIGVGHMLLSQYPLSEAAAMWTYDVADDDDAESRAFGYACLSVAGKEINVFFGETKSGDLAHAQHESLKNEFVRWNNQKSRQFILFGYNFGTVNNYPSEGHAVNRAGGGNVILSSTEIGMQNVKVLGTIKYPVAGESPIPIDYARIDPAIYAELVIAYA